MKKFFSERFFYYESLQQSVYNQKWYTVMLIVSNHSPALRGVVNGVYLKQMEIVK